MKLKIGCCPTCINTGKVTFVEIEPTNEGRFNATCDAGHEFDISVGYHDFQILFEIGINAIHDGYYREAIGSFTASYERFLEFFTRLITFCSKIDDSEIENSWKQVSKKSERQLGAFIFLYLITYKEAPPLLSTARVALRNEVIHKGKIPTRADCSEYGNDILKIILRVLRKLWKSHQYEVICSISQKMFPKDGPQVQASFLPWMMLSTNREPPAEGDEPVIEALLEGVAKARNMG